MAQLSGVTDNVSSTIADLNAIHSTDWVKYATGGTIVKSGGGATITDTPTGGPFDLAGNGKRTIGWTNGSPTGSGSDDNYRYVSLGDTETFTLPVGTGVTTAVVYLATDDFSVGVAQFSLTATLSDGSAGPYNFSSTGANNVWNITLTAQAASAGQTLTIAVTCTGSDWFAYAALGYSVAAGGIGPWVDQPQPQPRQITRRNPVNGEPLKAVSVPPPVSYAPDGREPYRPLARKQGPVNGEPLRAVSVPAPIAHAPDGIEPYRPRARKQDGVNGEPLKAAIVVPNVSWNPPDQQLRTRKQPSPYYQLFSILPAPLALIAKLRQPLTVAVDAVELVSSIDANEFTIAGGP